MSIKKVITELLTNSYIKNILLSVLSGFFGVCSGIVSSAIYSNSYTTTFVVFTVLGITALIITIVLNFLY